MSDSTQQYILKQPAEASYYEEGLMAVEFEDISECLIISDEQFENTFVPLDIPSIEKQLEEIIQFAMDEMMAKQDYWSGMTKSEVQKSIRDEALTEIKGLFGLENTESQK